MSLPTAERIEPTGACRRPQAGDMLLSAQKLSRHDLERALEVQRSMGGKLGRLLVSLGLVAEADVFAALARQADLPLLRSDAFPAQRPETPASTPASCWPHNLLPLGPALEGAEPPAFASADPRSETLRSALRLVFGAVPTGVRAETEIAARLNERWYVQAAQEDEEAAPGGAEASEFIEHLRDMASEAPIIQRVNQILAHAVTSKASDIHIETYEQKSVVRIRVDGEIFPVDEIDNKDAPAVVSRIKILSQLDIAERRMPQDGRTKLRVHGKEMDTRCAFYGAYRLRRIGGHAPARKELRPAFARKPAFHPGHAAGLAPDAGLAPRHLAGHGADRFVSPPRCTRRCRSWRAKTSRFSRWKTRSNTACSGSTRYRCSRRSA